MTTKKEREEIRARWARRYFGNVKPKYWEQFPELAELCDKDIHRLLEDVENLEELTLAVIEEFEDALGYVPEYFREKYDYDRFIKTARAAIGGDE